MLKCRFCGSERHNKNSLINHERLCPDNPDRVYRNGMTGKIAWNRGKTKETDPRILAQSEKIKEGILSGRVVPRRTPLTEEHKDLLSQLACERLQKHSKYSKNIEYNGTILESTFEVRVAIILDELGVDWIKVRQGYVWDDNGKRRRYVPDFFLPKYNIFLDPKNDYLIKKDARKIASAMATNNITVIVLSDAQINKEYIQSIIPAVAHGEQGAL